MSCVSPDLSGFTYGRLRVTGRAKSIGGAAHWRCICECGQIRVVRAQSLLRGVAKSCGCWRREASKERMRKVRGQRAMQTRYSFEDAVADTFSADPHALLKRLGMPIPARRIWEIA